MRQAKHALDATNTYILHLKKLCKEENENLPFSWRYYAVGVIVLMGVICKYCDLESDIMFLRRFSARMKKVMFGEVSDEPKALITRIKSRWGPTIADELELQYEYNKLTLEAATNAVTVVLQRQGRTRSEHLCKATTKQSSLCKNTRVTGSMYCRCHTE